MTLFRRLDDVTQATKDVTIDDTTVCLLLPMTVMDGLSFPSLLNRPLTSIFENGLSGFGSLGVPSTLVYAPTEQSQPDVSRVIVDNA